jgi:putative hydrolase of HD superfamily
MYRMSILPLFAPASLTSHLDIVKVTKMCLFHDISESLVGDITPLDAVPKSEKHRREASTISFLSNRVLAGVPSELEAIWHEFEAGETPEARFAQDLDKIELLLQAVEYEQDAKGEKDLSSFFKVAEKLVLPEMKEWAVTVLEERKAMWMQWGKTPISEGVGIGDNVIKQLDSYYDK